MMLLTDPYQACDECHRRAAYLIELGRYDERGYVDQESGANVCAVCLRAALALIDDDTPPQEQPT